MGMKILIILSLAATCLARHRTDDRKAFLFPSQPSSNKSSHTFEWPEFGNSGSLGTDISKKTEKTSEESGFVLTNPKRRDVKLGRGFPVFGFRGPLKQAQSDNIKSDATIKLESPSFIENATPVLEKGESSSSSESQAVDQQQSSSSEESSQSFSEETKAKVANPELSSITATVVEGKKFSSEETDAPNPNQDVVNDQEESPKKAPKPSLENQQSRVLKKENLFLKFGLQPSAQKYSLGDIDSKRPQPAKRKRRLGQRSLRSAEFNIPELAIKLDKGGSRNVQRPQGGIVANHKKKSVQKRFKK
ncbi:uncharacterized protein LOC121005555 [Bufo bufo]|uniref:uncharacterized protein LOC121005555 n=1 Tax=Bufo bufo TaxID=8384 RepID=UPI001ABE04F3|nr:uncharacterized protein LOC121005555 [Bufo bufo]